MTRRVKKPKADPFKGPYKFNPMTGEKAPWGFAWYWMAPGVEYVRGQFTKIGAWMLGRFSDEWGNETNPVTGEVAPKGKMWILNVMTGKWVLTSIGEPYTLSVASETYWST